MITKVILSKVNLLTMGFEYWLILQTHNNIQHPIKIMQEDDYNSLTSVFTEFSTHTIGGPHQQDEDYVWDIPRPTPVEKIPDEDNVIGGIYRVHPGLDAFSISGCYVPYIDIEADSKADAYRIAKRVITDLDLDDKTFNTLNFIELIRKPVT